MPGISHAQADRIGEKGVQSHAGRQGEWQFGVESHQESGEGRGDNRGGEQRLAIHAGRAQDGGIDGQDIGHGEEGCQAGDQFFPDGHASGIEIEKSLEHIWFPPSCDLDDLLGMSVLGK